MAAYAVEQLVEAGVEDPLSLRVGASVTRAFSSVA